MNEFFAELERQGIDFDEETYDESLNFTTEIEEEHDWKWVKMSKSDHKNIGVLDLKVEIPNAFEELYILFKLKFLRPKH
jgi:hypothetical protein